MENKKHQKLIASLTALTISLGLSGCCNENHEEKLTEYEQTITELEKEKEDLVNQKNDLATQLEMLTATPEPTSEPVNQADSSVEINTGYVIDKSLTIDSKTAETLFYNNKVLNVDYVSNREYYHYLDAAYGGTDNDGYVCCIEKDGKKYLVDASDYTRVYAANYDNIGSADYYRYLDAAHGGPDNDGYICIIKKDGKKYLVDASDYTRVYAEDFDHIEENKIYIKHADGTIDVYNATGLKPQKSYALMK